MFRPVVPRWAARCALQCLVSASIAIAPAFAVEDVGRWIPLLPPALEGHAALYDPAADHVFVFGGNSYVGGAYLNDTWMLEPAGAMEWFRVPVDASAITPRAYATVIHDPLAQRMIVFGGDAGGGQYPLSDVAALSLVPPYAWTVLSPLGDPGARMQHASAYDAARHRLVVFGGTNGYELFDDVWTLSLGATPEWTPLNPSGTPPPARCFAAAVYDPVRDRVIVIGGVTAGGVIVDDVWALDLAGAGAWTQLAPGGAAFGDHMAHVAVYDPGSDRVVVFGGLSLTEYLDEAWSLALAGSPAWSVLTPAGDPAPPLAFHAGAYDSRRDRLVAFGGGGADGYADCEVWTLTLGAGPAWTRRAAPTVLHDPSLTADPERDRAIVFGGLDLVTPTNAAWSLSLAQAAWTPLAPSGSPPAPRFDHAAVLDPARDRLLVFGGDDGAWGMFQDTWQLALDGPPAWTALAPSGTPPAARSAHSAILDPVRERMIVFGGRTPAGARHDVWVLELAGAPAWSPLTPSGTPPAERWNHVAIYDPAGDRMIVHGGENAGQWFDDAWALGLSGTPAWTPLAPGGEIPAARTGHHAVHDPLAQRMIVTGGTFTAECEVWALALSGAPEWTLLGPEGPAMPGRAQHTAAYDPARDRLLVFGGVGSSGDLWALTRSFGTVGAPAVAPAAALAASWAPNPSRGPAALAFALPAAGRVTVRVHDLAGRRVRTWPLGHLAAGTHRAAWDGRDDAGRELPPGVYFGEVRSDAGVTRARIAIVR